MSSWDRVIAAVIDRRAELGWTQKRLAEEAGVAERTIQNLEGGKRPQPLSRSKIERALGWKPGEFRRIAEAEDEPDPYPHVPPDVAKYVRRRWQRDPQEAAAVLADLEEVFSQRPRQEQQPGEDGQAAAQRAV